MVIIIKALRKNLRYELIQATKAFIKSRHEFYDNNLDSYKETIKKFNDDIQKIQEKSILSTFDSFGINKQEFDFFIRSTQSDKVLKALKKFHSETVPVNETIPQEFSLLKAVIIIKEYVDLLGQIQKNEDFWYNKYLALDSLWKKYDISELEIETAFKIYKDSPVISDLQQIIRSKSEDSEYTT